MNLCPCGARGDPAAECSCTPQRIAAYAARLSRALLDRFDLVLSVPRARATELGGGPGEPTAAVAARVEEGRGRLSERSPPLSADAKALLDRAVDRIPLSGRGRAKVGRVAQSAAALAGADDVAPEHIAEALSYRAPAELGAAP
jgi:magnesium chelatase family protein